MSCRDLFTVIVNLASEQNNIMHLQWKRSDGVKVGSIKGIIFGPRYRGIAQECCRLWRGSSHGMTR